MGRLERHGPEYLAWVEERARQTWREYREWRSYFGGPRDNEARISAASRADLFHELMYARRRVREAQHRW